jgi:hypothetical protein
MAEVSVARRLSGNDDLRIGHLKHADAATGTLGSLVNVKVMPGGGGINVNVVGEPATVEVASSEDMPWRSNRWPASR